MSPAENRQTNVLQEHRALFGFVPPSGGQARSSTNSQAKYPKKHVISTPSVQDKIQLGLAELGERKVVFERDGDLRHVHEKLYDEFSQLSDCGGYEILCTNAGLRELMSIPTPPGGYTVAFLRNVLGQAKGYLRPIQKDLSLAVNEEKVTLMNYCLLLT